MLVDGREPAGESLTSFRSAFILALFVPMWLSTLGGTMYLGFNFLLFLSHKSARVCTERPDRDATLQLYAPGAVAPNSITSS